MTFNDVYKSPDETIKNLEEKLKQFQCNHC